MLSLAIGVAVTLWVVWSIRKLQRYANAVESGKAVPVPPGTKLGTAPLGPLDCGRFSEFWAAH